MLSNSIFLIGFEFDGTALRDVSDVLDSYSPYLDANVGEVKLYDLGNLATEITLTSNAYKNIKQQWQKVNLIYFTATNKATPI
jgi:agmatinase